MVPVRVSAWMCFKGFGFHDHRKVKLKVIRFYEEQQMKDFRPSETACWELCREETEALGSQSRGGGFQEKP